MIANLNDYNAVQEEIRELESRLVKLQREYPIGIK